MPAPFSYLNILKSQAKSLAKSKKIMLSAAQEEIACRAGFEHFHELMAVAKRKPAEHRLMKAALGVSALADTLYDNDVRDQLEFLVDSELSSTMAETNAEAFTLEDEVVEFASFNEATGVATLDIRFTWQGVQRPDRMWSGTAFYIEARLQLLRRDGTWSIAEDDGLVIMNGNSDQDADYEAQWNDLEAEHQREMEQISSKPKTLAEALAEELQLAASDAAELVDADLTTLASDDGLVYGYTFDFDSVSHGKLRSMLIAQDQLVLRVGPNFLDNVITDL